MSTGDCEEDEPWLHDRSWRTADWFLFNPDGHPQICEGTRDAELRLVKRVLQISLYLMLKQTAIITGHYLAVLEHLRLG